MTLDQLFLLILRVLHIVVKWRKVVEEQDKSVVEEKRLSLVVPVALIHFVT